MGILNKLRRGQKKEIAKSFTTTKKFEYRKGNVALSFNLNKRKVEVKDFIELLAQAVKDCEAFYEESE